MGVAAAGAHELSPGPPIPRHSPWPPPHLFPLALQAPADPPGLAAAVADRRADRRGRRRAAPTRLIGDRGGGGPVQVAGGRPDRRAGPGTPWVADHGRGSAG